jgi:hypothetical protein
MTRDEAYEYLKSMKVAKTKLDEMADALGVEPYGYGSVEVIGARVAVGTVEAHGLEITVDANGNAVHVSSPHGFYLDEVQ